VKILITGFTSRMINSQRTAMTYLTAEPLLREILSKQLGHDVDHRRVTPGEDLSKYDLAILGICGIQTPAAAAANAAGTAWAFQKVKSRLLFCGDWTIEDAGHDFRQALNQWENFSAFKKYSAEDSNRVRAMLEGVSAERLTMLAPFFPWGNHELILTNWNRNTKKENFPSTTLCAWDPSPFCELPMLELPKEKARQWVYATLQNHDKWIDARQKGLKWPVVRREKENKISEDDLLKEYAQSWGILAPGYKCAGSGWWRARFNHAAQYRTIMACDPADYAVMGTPYKISPHETELLSAEQLEGKSSGQQEWFNANISTQEQTLGVLRNVIQATVAEPEKVLA
jgi:hypothetical protein